MTLWAPSDLILYAVWPVSVHNTFVSSGESSSALSGLLEHKKTGKFIAIIIIIIIIQADHIWPLTFETCRSLWGLSYNLSSLCASDSSLYNHTWNTHCWGIQRVRCVRSTSSLHSPPPPSSADGSANVSGTCWDTLVWVIFKIITIIEE